MKNAIEVLETPNEDIAIVEKYMKQVHVMISNPTFTKSKEFCFVVLS